MTDGSHQTAIAPVTPLLPMATGRLPRRTRSMYRRDWLAFATVCSLSAFFNLFQLQQNGYGNTYYAAAVKSMLQNWHNLFFVAFDPGGFVSVDKPPLGLWIQVLSARLFGFSSLSLLLPQALAGVLVVALLFSLVRRSFGTLAATLAALTMAITPVEVVMSRDNNLDVTLLLVLLLATWTMLRAVETRRLRWLLLSMALVGVGFNVKMLQAYLILPALVLFYLLFASPPWWRRLLYLVFALILLLIVSFSWITIVDLTPATQRPYVGSSQGNSELELALSYNGLARLFHPGAGSPPPPEPAHATSTASLLQSLSILAGQADPADESVMVNNPTGAPGPLRLVTGPLGAQGSWLLLFALVSLPVLAWQRRWRKPLSVEIRALVLWGGWLLFILVALSPATHIQSYYTIMLAPPLSVLTGIALALLWRDYCRRSRNDWRGRMLPLALLITVIFQITLLSAYMSWSSWLSPLLLLLVLLAILLLIVLRRLRLTSHLQLRLARVALVLGLLAILVAPFTWSASSLTYANNGGFPVAGPSVATLQGTLSVLGQSLANSARPPRLPVANQRLLNYLLVNDSDRPFLLGTLSSTNAIPFILATGLPVMTLGGYSGNDPILTTSQLAALVAHGAVRFFWLPFLFKPGRGAGQFVAQGGRNSVLTRWVASHCTLSSFQLEKPGSLNTHFTRPFITTLLYDCG